MTKELKRLKTKSNERLAFGRNDSSSSWRQKGALLSFTQGAQIEEQIMKYSA